MLFQSCVSNTIDHGLNKADNLTEPVVHEKSLINKDKNRQTKKSQIMTACKNSPKPLWLIQYQKNPIINDGYYYGVNFAEFSGNNLDFQTIELAKKRAIDDLSLSLSVSIKSAYEEYLSTYNETQIQSSLMVSTRLVLSGININQQWANCGKGLYWVMVSIDREKAEAQLQDQRFINEVAERLEKKQDEIQNGMMIISKAMARKMHSFENQVKRLENLSQTIDKKITAAGSQSEKEYNEICKQIDKLSKNFYQQQELLKKSYDEKTQELIQQNNRLLIALQNMSQKINNDYFLNYIDNDNSRPVSNFQISIEPFKGQGADYFEGERIKFRVTTTQDCYIKVLYISADGTETMLLPNLYDKDNRLMAGQEKIIGRMGELIVQSPFGKDIVSVSASKIQFTDIDAKLQQVKENKTGGFYTRSLQNPLNDVKMRGIGVAKPEDLQTDTCYIVSHKR